MGSSAAPVARCPLPANAATSMLAWLKPETSLPARWAYSLIAFTSLLGAILIVRSSSIGLTHHSPHSASGQNAAAFDCILAATDGNWRRTTPDAYGSSTPPQHVAVRDLGTAFTHFNESLLFQWEWAPHPHCSGIRRRTRQEIRTFFKGKFLLFIGDSHIRYLHNALADTLGGDPLPKGSKPAHKAQVSPDGVHLQLNMSAFANDVLNMLLFRRVTARWPDYLILDASVWHLYKGDRLSQYQQQMEHLLNVVRVRVPPHTQVFWLSPPARGSLRQHYQLRLPADWVPIYARVAGDLGFFVPQGPAIHLDQLSIGFGCLPFCLLEDGSHAKPVLLDLMQQLLVNAAEQEQQRRGKLQNSVVRRTWQVG